MCGFLNRRTGQDLDVELGYANEFGVLDPWFFARFVKSTPGHRQVDVLFRDDYHDPCRALQVLEEQGRLLRVERYLWRGAGGLIAPDDPP